MTARRILTAILGVLTIIAGFFCLMWPGMTYVSMVWLIGVVMVVDGIANIISWSDRRAAGLADGWSLAGAIVSILFGIVLLASNLMQVVMEVFVAYMVAAWLLIYGAIRVVMAFKVRSLRKTLGSDADPVEPRWGWILCMGILMIICGVIGFFAPLSLMLAMGVIAGIAIVIFGADLIMMAVVA